MRIFLLNIALIIIFSPGCNKFLELVPEKDVETIESIFEVKKSAYDFYNSCMAGIIHELCPGDIAYDPSYLCGGEYAISEFARKSGVAYLGNIVSISDGYQNSNTPYANRWVMGKRPSTSSTGSIYACIRYCNIFIENIDKVNNMPIWEKKAWKAEIKCLKAFYYFEMVKMYGPIVLVPQNIQSNAEIEAMQTPRSHIDTCFNTIVSLFDEAMPDLRIRNEMPRESKACFSKEAALAYKAKALLYAASPLFNGNIAYSQFKNRDGKPLFNSTYDPEKWKRAAEAIDEAIRVAKENKIELYGGSKTKQTEKLNKIYDIQYSVIYPDWSDGEWIFMQTEQKGNSKHYKPRYKTGTAFTTPAVYGSMAPNIATVELFYTDNGVPISKDKTWPYNNRYKMGRETNTEYKDIVMLETDVLNLHLRREPRFYANIAADGTFEVFTGKYYPVEPLKGQSRGTEASRFNDGTTPQNITGYWIKKNNKESDRPADVSSNPIVLMRLSDLYLMQAEAWNEYSGPSEKVYDAIDAVRKRAGILPIRQAWAQYSTSPNEVLNKDGLRKAIHQERMIEFVFEGHHFWDLKRWKEAENVLNKPHYGWNVMGEDKRTFYNNFEQPIIVSTKAQFIAPRDYFWPIKSEEIMIANIVQNPGW